MEYLLFSLKFFDTYEIYYDYPIFSFKYTFSKARNTKVLIFNTFLVSLIKYFLRLYCHKSGLIQCQLVSSDFSLDYQTHYSKYAKKMIIIPHQENKAFVGEVEQHNYHLQKTVINIQLSFLGILNRSLLTESWVVSSIYDVALSCSFSVCVKTYNID